MVPFVVGKGISFKVKPLKAACSWAASSGFAKALVTYSSTPVALSATLLGQQWQHLLGAN